MAQHNELGKWGEQAATEYLVGKGYAITEHNWRSGHYEIDIIAMNGNRIVFVEVKTRRDYDEDPFAAITPAKISRLVRAANAYVIAYDIPHDVQYDFIAVMGNPHEYKIVHLPDVWVPLSCTRRR